MATLSDEELNSASSESEDDLPTLSTIMTKSPSRKQPAIKTADEVLTPRRTKKHTDNDELVLGSPLRSPTTSRVRNTKSKARSLNDLLKDKAKDDDIQSKVDDIMKMKEMELDDYGENSEEKCDRNAIGELYGDYSQEFSQDVDVLDDSNDSIEVKFSYALSRDFPDTFPGIELFVRPADDVDPVMLLEGLLEYFEDESIGISKADLVDEDLSRENVHEIIGQIVGDLSCQTEMKERDLWCKIWKILCFVENCEVCYAAYECLSSHFKMCSKNSINPPWIPSVIELLESVIGIGASPSIVSTIEYVYPELDTSIFESLDCSGEEQFVNARAIRKDIHRRLYTVQFITKLFTDAVQTFPGQYNVDELRAIFMLVSHLSVDKLFQSVLIDFKVLLASILDTYNDEAMWETEVENLVRDFLSLDWHHRNLLQGVESVLTSTKRGFHFQQVLAINVAIKIIKDREKKNQSEGGESETDDMDEEKGRKIFSNYPVKLKLVHQVLNHIKSNLKDIDEDNDDTDYHEISTVLFLIGLCSKVELQCNPERAKMCKSIINTLTFVNDAIKECMGRHMDRTKLKNQVIRLSNKFELMKSRSESQTQSYLSSYFDCDVDKIDEEEAEE